MRGGAVEIVAEALWQQDAIRCLGRKRRELWSEQEEKEQSKWLGLANAGLTALLDFGFTITPPQP